MTTASYCTLMQSLSPPGQILWEVRIKPIVVTDSWEQSKMGVWFLFPAPFFWEAEQITFDLLICGLRIKLTSRRLFWLLMVVNQFNNLLTNEAKKGSLSNTVFIKINNKS